MSFLGDFLLALRFAKELMFNFKEATKNEASISELLYYLFLILLVPSIILSTLLYLGGSSYYTEYSKLVDSILAPVPILKIPTYFVLFIGQSILGALLGAGITQFFGKLFRWIKKEYRYTLAGIIYGFTPVAIFVWVGHW